MFLNIEFHYRGSEDAGSFETWKQKISTGEKIGKDMERNKSRLCVSVVHKISLYN
jgi:hypothetical protein